MAAKTSSACVAHPFSLVYGLYIRCHKLPVSTARTPPPSTGTRGLRSARAGTRVICWAKHLSDPLPPLERTSPSSLLFHKQPSAPLFLVLPFSSFLQPDRSSCRYGRPQLDLTIPLSSRPTWSPPTCPYRSARLSWRTSLNSHTRYFTWRPSPSGKIRYARAP